MCEVTMVTHELAKEAFRLMRQILTGKAKGGGQAALDLACVLQDLPEPNNTEAIQTTYKRMCAFEKKHPELGEQLMPYISMLVP